MASKISYPKYAWIDYSEKLHRFQKVQYLLKQNQYDLNSGGAKGGLRGLVSPNLKSRQKFSKKNGIKLVGYTFRLKNYVKIQPISL